MEYCIASAIDSKIDETTLFKSLNSLDFNTFRLESSEEILLGLTRCIPRIAFYNEVSNIDYFLEILSKEVSDDTYNKIKTSAKFIKEKRIKLIKIASYYDIVVGSPNERILEINFIIDDFKTIFNQENYIEHFKNIALAIFEYCGLGSSHIINESTSNTHIVK